MEVPYMYLIGSYTLKPTLPEPLVILEAFIFTVPVVDPSESTSKLQSDKNSMYASCAKLLLFVCDSSDINRKEIRVKVEKKRVQRPTKEQKEAMNKVVDEMVAEPKKNNNASALKQLMSATVSDAEKLKEYQGDAYVECVSKLKMPEDVEVWDNEQMTTFLDVFHKLVEKDKGLGDLNEVFVTEDITDKGGDEMGDEWKSNPATEAQLKWCKDIVAKATDKNIDGLAELKTLYNGGDINGETASEIISNWNDKVK